MHSDRQQVLIHLRATLPHEIALVDHLAISIRQLNEEDPTTTIDLEPVLVTKMWMQRILRRAEQGKVDAKGVFELAKCVARQMLAIHHMYVATLTRNLSDCDES